MKNHIAATAAALAVLMLAGSPAAQATPPAAPLTPSADYVVMGDSFASGSGVVPYAPGTFALLGAKKNNCQRSLLAYPTAVARTMGYTVRSVACQGAETSSFYEVPADRAAWGERPQLDALSATTELVSFSMGGNDAGFAPVLMECLTKIRFILPFNNCSGDAAINKRVNDAIAALDGRGTVAGIRSYDEVLADIRDRAPHARVVGVGYPAFFPEGGGGGLLTLGQRCQAVKRADQRWIVAKTVELNAVIRSAMERNGYTYADAQEQFVDHELCGSGAEYLNGLVSLAPFHPNTRGQSGLAASVVTALRASGGGVSRRGGVSPAAAAEATAGDVTAITGAADTDHDGAEPDTGTVTDSVPDVEARPLAAFAVSRDGEVVSLDATASRASDEGPITAEWYVEGAVVENVAVGDRVALDLHSVEPVSVTLVVTDAVGRTDFATATVAAGRLSSAPREIVADGRVAVTLPSTPEVRMSEAINLDSLTWPAAESVPATVRVDDASGDVTVSGSAAQLGIPAGESTVCLSGEMTDGRPLSSCVPVQLTTEAVAASARLAGLPVPRAGTALALVDSSVAAAATEGGDPEGEESTTPAETRRPNDGSITLILVAVAVILLLGGCGVVAAFRYRKLGSSRALR